MKKTALLAALFLLLVLCLEAAQNAPVKHVLYGNHGLVLLPNHDATPGEVRTTDVNEVCHGGSTRQYRHTTSAEKKQVCAMYGVVHCPWQGMLELDHLVPLELGGADTVANLWPQPSTPPPGFREKDILENYLHKKVCDGKMALIAAQAAIRTDWYEAYLSMKKEQVQ
jgi:hypothetical protein